MIPARSMNNRLGNTVVEDRGTRRLACSACGTEFSCDLSGRCWCMEETARLPMPAEGGDCLCRDCLHAMAETGPKSQTA
jgi:hypothetical protein